MATAAKQPIYRLTTHLAYNIPQGNLNTADGCHYGRATLILIADHAAYHIFDVERVAPNHATLCPLMTHGLNRLLLPFQRCLTYACHSLIRGEAQKQIVP